MTSATTPSWLQTPPALGAVAGTLEVAVSRHYGTSILLSFPPVQQACAANVCRVMASFDHLPPLPLTYQMSQTTAAPC